MTEANAAGTAKGPGIVLQPEEGESYWQPVWANGYSTVKISPKNGTLNLAMGVQVIAPGGYVREHSHTPNQEILFCFEGKGAVLVDGVPHPFVPGTTVYAGPGVRHKIINDGPGELKMTWTYLPPGLDDFFAAIGRPQPWRAGAGAVCAPRRSPRDRGSVGLRPAARGLVVVKGLEIGLRSRFLRDQAEGRS